MNRSKEQFISAISQLLNNLNGQLLQELKAYFGGGTMLAYQNNFYRISHDLDFLCNPTEYRKLKQWFNVHQPEEIFVDNSKIAIAGDLRKDQYSITMPVSITCNDISTLI